MGHAPGCLDLWGHGAAAILAQRAVRFPDAECDVAGVDQRQVLVVEPHGLGSNAHFDRLICWKPSAPGKGWQTPARMGLAPGSSLGTRPLVAGPPAAARLWVRLRSRHPSCRHCPCPAQRPCDARSMPVPWWLAELVSYCGAIGRRALEYLQRPAPACATKHVALRIPDAWHTAIYYQTVTSTG